MSAQKLAAHLRADVEDVVRAFGTWRFWRAILATAVGTTIFCIGINGVIVPHKFIAGGISGISLLVYYLVGWPSLGLIYWAINVPILLLAWRTMSLRYVVVSLAGVFMTGLCLDFTRGVHIPIHEPILAAILAGCLMGTGVGFYLRFGGSTGGMDIVATLVKRRFGVAMGVTMISVNVLNVVANGFVSSLDVALASGIALYVHSVVIDRFQAGFSQRKLVFIVSSKAHELSELITKQLGCGVTCLHAAGGYRHREGDVLYTVINVVELARLKELLYANDRDVFVAITDASEVIGTRFLTWEQQGFEHTRKIARSA